MSKERQRLNLSLDELFPGKSITIGEQSILIQPLVLEQISIFTKRFKDISKALEDDGITWDNFEEPQNLLAIVTKLVTQFPELLEEASNIAKEDLVKLPVEVVIQIFLAVVEVNIQSKDELLGNLQSLIEMWNPQKKKVPAKRGKIQKKQKSQKQSKN